MNMHRRAWLRLIVPLILLALITGFVVWTLPAPNASIQFVRFESRDGQRFAVFKVRNQSAADLNFPGNNGTPQSTILEQGQGRPVSGPAWTGLPKGTITNDVLVPAGTSLEFAVPLRWMIDGEPIRNSFRIGLIDPTAERSALRDFLRLRWLRKPRPLEQHPWIWSDVVSP